LRYQEGFEGVTWKTLGTNGASCGIASRGCISGLHYKAHTFIVFLDTSLIKAFSR
jgi:hypothetical protein